MRVIKVIDKNLVLKDKAEVVFEKTVTKFGSGAKIDCPKEHMGKRVYVIVRKPERTLKNSVRRRSLPSYAMKQSKT